MALPRNQARQSVTISATADAQLEDLCERMNLSRSAVICRAIEMAWESQTAIPVILMLGQQRALLGRLEDAIRAVLDYLATERMRGNEP